MKITLKPKCKKFFIFLFILISISATFINLLNSSSFRHNKTFRYVACLLGIDSLANVTQSIGHCSVFQLHVPTKAGHECVTMATNPSPWICIHKPEDDRFISGTIKDGAVWEEHIVSLFQQLLRVDPNLAVIDIGANIGQYSLLGAKMNRRVVAVEASIKHVQMLQRAVIMNKVEQNVTLVHNAVSDSHRKVILQYSKDNRGATRIVNTDNSKFVSQSRCEVASSNSVETILMDDLLEVIKFSRAVMKIDIEGHEIFAIPYSARLIDQVYLPYIIMEWAVINSKYTDDEFRHQGVIDLLKFMSSQHYEPYTIAKTKLDPSRWMKWPQDIIWKHKLATFPGVEYAFPNA